MSLQQIKEEISAINEGLYYGDVEFSYDAMGFAIAFSHPSEILGDMCGELEDMIENEYEDLEALNMMLSGMKEMRYSFDLVDLKKPIETLEAYLSAK